MITKAASGLLDKWTQLRLVRRCADLLDFAAATRVLTGLAFGSLTVSLPAQSLTTVNRTNHNAILQVLPSAQTSDGGSLSARATNGFTFRLIADPNASYAIQASSDLQTWLIIATNRVPSSGYSDLKDPTALLFDRRYYRAQLLSLPLEIGPAGPAAFRPDRILVKPKPGLELAVLHLLPGALVLQSFSAIGNLQVMQVPAGSSVATLVQQYQQSGLVVYAEPDYLLHALLTPNDFRYNDGSLWGLHNTGVYGGTAGADIKAPEAWDLQHTATNLIVAVIDTGIRYTHEDLAANMWVNPADGSHGTNTIAGNTDPNDDQSHGTHVAGVIGAVGNNSVGVVGVAWQVPLMACKFLDSSGNGTISDAIKCIDYARAHGAKVINASWGSTSFTSTALHDAIASARDAGIIWVAAAGNSNNDNDTTPLYPASYRDLDNVVAVTATTRNDTLASFSNYGAKTVDLAAPGAAIFSSGNASDTDYSYMDGSSFSAAYMSGACAVVWANHPGDTYRQVINRILGNTDSLPSLSGKCITGGRLNLYRALTGTNAPPPPPPPPSGPVADFTANPTSGPAPLTVQFTDKSTGTITAWDWNFGDGSADASAQNPSHTFTNAGNYTVTLTVTGSGGATNSKSLTIQATAPPPPPPPPSGPVADFTANPTSGPAPLTVQFTDKSTGTITAWDWNFGDGSADASAQNPSHTFTNAGNYTVTLTVTGSGGATNSKSLTIQATAPPPPPPPPSGPVADFTASPTSGPAPLTVQFTDKSTGTITAWDWNFGDGSADASAQNPSHTFTNAGNYTVTLTVTGSGGATNSKSLTIQATAPPPPPPPPSGPVADFTASPTSGPAPLTVQFTDKSTGTITAWDWNFGDGSADASAQNPSHTFTNAGNYTVTLTVTGSGATNSKSLTIQATAPPPPPPPPAPVADFLANPTSGQAPLKVQFTDKSTGTIATWDWNFGDGSADATAQNPSHTFTNAGNYTVTLTVTGSGGTSSKSQKIQVGPPPTANFTANPSSGQAPLAVQFTDQSTGTIVAWEWDFGDGSSHSSAVNPSHTYVVPGSYTATLTVTGMSGMTSSKSATIQVTAPPVLPVVTVVGGVPLPLSSQPQGSSPGGFVFSRTGSTAGPLVVHYSIGGTAVNGVDYQTLPTSVIFPAGASSATLPVNPSSGGLIGLPETIILTLTPDPSYTVGLPSVAELTLLNGVLGVGLGL